MIRISIVRLKHFIAHRFACKDITLNDKNLNCEIETLRRTVKGSDFDGTLNDKNLNCEIETRHFPIYTHTDTYATNDKNLNSEIETPVKSIRPKSRSQTTNDKILRLKLSKIVYDPTMELVLRMIRISILRLKRYSGCLVWLIPLDATNDKNLNSEIETKTWTHIISERGNYEW